MPKKSQIDKFREKAREIGADADEAGFDEALRKVASKDPKKVDEGLKDLAERIGQVDPQGRKGR